MNFIKKIAVCFFLFLISTLIFAAFNKNQKVIQFLNHASNLNQNNYLTDNLIAPNSLEWISLKGPKIAKAMTIKTGINNPELLYAFDFHNGYPENYRVFFYKSLDGGKNWKKINLPNNKYLQDLIAIDKNTLLIATHKGMYLYKDNENQWIQLEKTPIHIEHLFALTSQWIVASGFNAKGHRVIYLSENAGRSWKIGGLGLFLFEKPTHLSGHGKFLALGAQNGLSVSMDGGQLWSQPSHQWKNLQFGFESDAVAMSQEQDIYVNVNGIATYKTDVSGKTWEKISDVTGIIKLDKNDNVYFLSRTIEEDPLGKNILYKSNNKGRDWKILQKFDAIQHIRDFNVLDNNKIVLSSDRDGLILSDENQMQFTNLSNLFSVSTVTSVLETDNGTLFALDRETLYRKLKNQEKWHKIYDINAVSHLAKFKNAIVIMVHNKHLLSTMDEGENWQDEYLFDDDVNAFESNGQTIWLNKNNDLYFSNNLQNWIKYSASSSSSTKESISGNHIYEIRNVGEEYLQWLIRVSHDQGKTWKTALDNIFQVPVKITSHGQLVLASFTNAGIIKSIDGGDNWEVINQGLGSNTITEIIIQNQNTYLASDGKHVFTTKDGGMHWVNDSYGLNHLFIINLFANKKIVLAGTYGNGVYLAKL